MCRRQSVCARRQCLRKRMPLQEENTTSFVIEAYIYLKRKQKVRPERMQAGVYWAQCDLLVRAYAMADALAATRGHRNPAFCH